MEQAPFPFIWNGEAMVPPRAFARRADQIFVVGQSYTLVEVQDRSSASHRQYFALVREAFVNLPEAGYGDAIDVEAFTNLIGAYMDAAPAERAAA
jgi:DNA recombination-dependent growth factor C